mmetsp:Transcript_128068/g.362519  ORF Transcript_128068/g.362519 Transcript_128068/m.362519 type:complete len:282 (-) Transcript_128068:183-1028(-)
MGVAAGVRGAGRGVQRADLQDSHPAPGVQDYARDPRGPQGADVPRGLVPAPGAPRFDAHAPLDVRRDLLRHLRLRRLRHGHREQGHLRRPRDHGQRGREGRARRAARVRGHAGPLPGHPDAGADGGLLEHGHEADPEVQPLFLDFLLCVHRCGVHRADEPRDGHHRAERAGHVQGRRREAAAAKGRRAEAGAQEAEAPLPHDGHGRRRHALVGGVQGGVRAARGPGQVEAAELQRGGVPGALQAAGHGRRLHTARGLPRGPRAHAGRGPVEGHVPRHEKAR